MPHTCLVVSDDEAFGLLRDLLTSERRAIFHAPTGAAALRWIADRCSPTIVLLDLPLADMSGSEFIESARCDPDRARMVATVCLVGEAGRAPQRAFRTVRKPSTARELLGAIADARRQLAAWGTGAPESVLDRYVIWRSRRGRSALV